jgi:hypothetical protein
MSADDLSEYISEGRPDSELLDRTSGGEIAQSITQRGLELVADGVREQGGVGSGTGSHQRVMRNIVGGSLNRETMSGLQEDISYIARAVGANSSSTSMTGMIGDIVSTVSVRNTMNDYANNVLGPMFESVGMFDEGGDPVTISEYPAISEFGGSDSTSGDSGDADLNGDGRIDGVEIAVSKSGERLEGAMRDILTPLKALANRNPTFYRTIKKKRVGTESTKAPGNQKHLVEQGIANYTDDANLFSVRF